MIHFDAHCDTWETTYDSTIGHLSWLRTAINENLIDTKRTISIGIRGPATLLANNFLMDSDGTVFTARYAETNLEAVISNILGRVGNSAVYMTFDVSAIDPCYAPGVGLPMIGGLSTSWVMACLEELRSLNWVGMDIVEVSPGYDHSNITALTAATVAWTYLCMLVVKNLYRSYDTNELT